MTRDDFIKRSPLRILEASIHSRAGQGSLGVIAARQGVGKTACLVQLALDRLFQQESVIHVSFASRVDHILNWYEDIFREIAKTFALESAADVYADVIKNRVVMNFRQEGIKSEQVLRSLEAMIHYGKFGVETIIIDGYRFIDSSVEDLHRFKHFAHRMKQKVWFSASLKGEEPLFDERGLPRELKRFVEAIDVLMTMRSETDRVRLWIVKDHDHPPAGELDLSLDPTSLLISSS